MDKAAPKNGKVYALRPLKWEQTAIETNATRLSIRHFTQEL